MFFLISKLSYIALMPLSWVSLLIILGFVFRKKQKTARTLWIASLILFFIFGNDWLANKALSQWEMPARAIASLSQQKYKTAIVTGGVTQRRQPDDRIYYGPGADRVLHAATLYKEGIIEYIILSGGVVAAPDTAASEAELMKQTLLLHGIPDSIIFTENRSINTYQNAVYTRVLLEQTPAIRSEKYLLITSAFHMRRAVACFKKQNIAVEPFPADFRTSVYGMNFLLQIVPSAAAFAKWDLIIREWAGITIYKWSGYI